MGSARLEQPGCAPRHRCEYPSTSRPRASRATSAYLVIIEHEGDSCGAYCPDLPGVGVAGDTREEVDQLIREAIAFHLETGQPIPAPAAVATTHVDVPAA
jgi:predicted RNase H-like HicB family nuclease